MNVEQLNAELDRTKVDVFVLGKHSMFLGTVMAHMEMEWSDSIPTAGVSATTLYWNPDFFKKSDKALRINVMVHEINHVARMHRSRREDRDPEIWNIACDIRINTDMEEDGLIWDSFDCYKDRKREFVGMSEEQIYEIIKEDPSKISGSSAFGVDEGSGQYDMLPMPDGQEVDPMAEINIVVAAIQTTKSIEAQRGNYSTDFPGNIEEIIRDFLAPKVKWEKEVRQFIQELGSKRYSYDRPNRRYQHVILPRRKKVVDRLGHVCFFVDSSGSISNEQIKRIGSEIKHIWDRYRPKKMSVHQFTTEITHTMEWSSGQTFNEFFVKGRGGTSLVPVRAKIIEEMPTAVVIFSDLQCAPMKKLPREFNDVPVIWVVVDNKFATVSFGRKIHVETI